jgi:hypothetical protein
MDRWRPIFLTLTENVVIDWISTGAKLPADFTPALVGEVSALAFLEPSGTVEGVKRFASAASLSELSVRTGSLSLLPPRKRPGFAERRRLIGMGAVH